MKLASVSVTKFRNILDSGEVKIQPDVTCMVGKNEAGKSAFLHALHRLRPAEGKHPFVVLDDYPAWLQKKDAQNEDLKEVRPVSVDFELEDADAKVVAEKLGNGVLAGNVINLEKGYNGTLYYNIDVSEEAAVKFVLKGLGLSAESAAQAKGIKTVTDLRALAASLQGGEGEETKAAGKSIAEKVKGIYGDKDVQDVAWKLLEPRVPVFFYFSKYAELPYTADIRRVLTADDLKEEEQTVRSLLRMAAAEDSYLLSDDYEQRTREVQNCAAALKNDVLAYWTQNSALRVDPQVLPEPNNGRTLKLRIWDDRHDLSLPFDRHSTGFRWFFSFLAAFSKYRHSDKPVIILLDEPALGLHAKAQADFLRFIEDGLSSVGRQVIYTTHSPFMVQAKKLERVRLVEDKGREHGTKVTANVMSTDRDTLFPLQGALGYDLVQHLLINEHNLVVEGTSDFTYLTVISDWLAEQGREALDARWSVVPVGGVDLVPSFVALLGNHLDVTVVIDAQRAGHQRLTDMAANGILEENRIITIGQVLGRKFADVEDLFDPEDYLSFFNPAIGQKVKVADLKGNDPITKQLARAMGLDGDYNHGKPADRFLRQRAELLPKLSKATLDNFEKLFKVVNATLPTAVAKPLKKPK